jgi:hypothetical protein
VTAWSRQVVSDNDLAARSRKHNRGQRGFTWLHAHTNPVLAEPGGKLIGVPSQLQFVDCDLASGMHDGRRPGERRSSPPLDEKRQHRSSGSMFDASKPPPQVSPVSSDA